MLALVPAGLSNHEIANTLFLSINSGKPCIRSTYRKMDVATRSQAVLWAIQHGFPAPELPHSVTDIEAAGHQPWFGPLCMPRVATEPQPRGIGDPSRTC